MSGWRFGKNGISLNEGGMWITFSYIRLPEGDSRGEWMSHSYFFGKSSTKFSGKKGNVL